MPVFYFSVKLFSVPIQLFYKASQSYCQCLLFHFSCQFFYFQFQNSLLLLWPHTGGAGIQKNLSWYNSFLILDAELGWDIVFHFLFFLHFHLLICFWQDSIVSICFWGWVRIRTSRMSWSKSVSLRYSTATDTLQRAVECISQTLNPTTLL